MCTVLARVFVCVCAHINDDYTTLMMMMVMTTTKVYGHILCNKYRIACNVCYVLHILSVHVYTIHAIRISLAVDLLVVRGRGAVYERKLYYGWCLSVDIPLNGTLGAETLFLLHLQCVCIWCAMHRVSTLVHERYIVCMHQQSTCG